MTGHDEEGVRGDLGRREEIAWVGRIASGDPDALAEAYHTHADHVYGIAFGIIRSMTDAEDVVQEIFAALPEKAKTFQGRAAFSTWLYRVVVRTAMASVQDNRRRRRLLEDLDRIGGRRSHAADDPVTRIAVERGYASLPVKYRAVLWLRAREGWSHAEIAETLGISVDLSCQWLHRAREQLQRAMRGAR